MVRCNRPSVSEVDSIGFEIGSNDQRDLNCRQRAEVVCWMMTMMVDVDWSTSTEK